MKIGNSPDGSAGPAKVEARAAARRPEAGDAARQAASAPAASTQVALSSAAKLAASAGGDDGSFDAAKVERISKAITEGKFTVNADAIADKLVANAQELLDTRVNKQH